MNYQKRVALLALALLPWRVAMAEAPHESDREAPVVESATLPPANVESAGPQGADVRLRLQDPVRGGLLSAGEPGTALLVGNGEASFVAAAAIEFLAPGTTVELRVVDGRGDEVDSVVISSQRPSRWSADLCRVRGANARVDMLVRTGSALATAYRLEADAVTTIPILSRATVVAAKGGTAAFTSVRPSGAISPLSEGSSSYSRSYDWPGTNFTFAVSGAPPNTCGEIHTLRDGAWVVTSNWICTDGTGYGRKGPWYITTTFPGADQTDSPTYILWPDGSTTTSTWHVIDVTSPLVTITSGCNFCGTANDGPWGAGFSTAWNTRVTVSFQDGSTGLWWSTGYPGAWHCSDPLGTFCWGGTPDIYQATTNIPASGNVHQLNWSTWTSPACLYGHRCVVWVTVPDLWSKSTKSQTFSCGGAPSC